MTANRSDLPTLGRYQLRHEIARSNDIVYEGFDPQMSRRVAVKELAMPPSLSGQARRERIERFYREARAAGGLSHPNIVTIYEIGEDRGRYFIAMEYLEGRTLRERLSVGGALPPREAVAIATTLCDALEYAHQRGVVHRDVKPDNIHLLPGGIVKLTDFGIARITHEDSMTQAGQRFGTPSYMSPEQIKGLPVDARSDLFSLGIVLYEMLTGRKPFSGDSLETITYRIVHEEPAPGPGLTPVLDSVIRRALAKDPQARFSSASEMRVALMAGEQGDVTVAAAGPVSLPEKTSLYTAGAPFAAGPPTGIAAPTTMNPASVPDDRPVAPGRNPGRNLAILLISMLVVLSLITGGSWMLSRAYQGFRFTALVQEEGESLKRAVALAQANRFSEAIPVLEKLQANGHTSETRSGARSWLVHSYVKSGELAQDNRQYETAERFYQAAATLSPEDANIRRRLDDVRAARGAPPQYRVPGVQPAPSGSGSTATPEPPPTTGSGTVPVPAPPPVASRSDERMAQDLLQRGVSALQQGRREEALNYFYEAERAAIGSAASIEARRRINALNDGGL